VQLAGRMDDKRSRRDLDGAARGGHPAPAADAKIDLRCLRMTVIGTDLTGLPASNGDITLANGGQHLFDMSV
jgi:hypothetical protein